MWAWLAHREIGYTLVHLAADLLPFLGVAAVSIAGAWFLTRWIGIPWLLMVAKIVVTAALYIFLMWISRSVTFRESVQFILRRNNQ